MFSSLMKYCGEESDTYLYVLVLINKHSEGESQYRDFREWMEVRLADQNQFDVSHIMPTAIFHIQTKLIQNMK